jgi:CBS domain containing-hemolysin-like protein
LIFQGPRLSLRPKSKELNNYMVTLVIFFLISIIFSFLCSVWEAVLLSIPPSKVEMKFQEGGKVGELLKKFKDNIDQPLAAILTLNTIAHTVGAIGVGASAENIWPEGSGIDLPLYFTDLHIGAGVIVAILMTLAILILSELIPKTIGANKWEDLIGFTVKSLEWVIWLLWPLVWLGQKITKSLKKDKSKSVLSRADFSAMTALGEKEGVFKAGESKIIHNLLRFNEIRTKDIMTPRTVVIAAKDDMTIQDFYNKNKTLRFSRIPIYDDTKDHINGFILKDILLINLVNNNGNKLLKEIKREILIVHERLNIPDLFNKLMESREHIALVVGEFGGMSGIVTMEDVIETLLGMEIVDEFDNTADMQQLARRNWEKRAEGLGILKNNENENIDPKQ